MATESAGPQAPAPKDSRTSIILGALTLIGVLATAIFGNWDKLSGTKSDPKAASVPSTQISASQSASASGNVQVTGTNNTVTIVVPPVPKPEEVAAALQKERDSERARNVERRREEAKAQAETEGRRRLRVLTQLHELYVLSHDGISPELMARTAPMPKAWVEEQLKKMGESWRQDQYY